MQLVPLRKKSGFLQVSRLANAVELPRPTLLLLREFLPDGARHCRAVLVKKAGGRVHEHSLVRYADAAYLTLVTALEKCFVRLKAQLSTCVRIVKQEEIDVACGDSLSTADWDK